jgi:proteasome assembly chaperone (PAC2) family protein
MRMGGRRVGDDCRLCLWKSFVPIQPPSLIWGLSGFVIIGRLAAKWLVLGAKLEANAIDTSVSLYN